MQRANECRHLPRKRRPNRHFVSPMPHDDRPNDGEVIAAVLHGETERFAILVERYRRALMRFAYSRLGQRDWAEDAVQETLMCAFKSLHSYDSRFSFRTWLWTILLNQCRRHARKHRFNRGGDNEQRTSRRLAHLVLESRETEPSEQLMLKERTKLLEKLLDQIPANEADALRLRFFGGLKFQEIADTMQCSLSGAKKRVRTGLKRISNKIGEQDDPIGVGFHSSSLCENSKSNTTK